MAHKVKYRVRKFLNAVGHHSIAFIFAEIDGGVTLKIGDCERVISLDFGGYGPNSKKNAVAKAKLLASVLTEFAAKLEEHYRSGGESEEW